MEEERGRKKDLASLALTDDTILPSSLPLLISFLFPLFSFLLQAASWAFNGILQSLETSVVAGNRNADDISPELREFTYLLYASQSIHRTTEDLNAALLTSFGFGQVGGIVLTLHPYHLLARLDEGDFEAYKKLRAARQGKTYTRMHSALTKEDLVRVKDQPPYPAELEDQVLLNTNARAIESNGSFAFVAPLAAAPSLAPVASSKASSASSHHQQQRPVKSQEAAAQQQTLEASLGSVQGVGIDVESTSEFPSDNETFVSRK